jgi:anti-repressor protein
MMTKEEIITQAREWEYPILLNNYAVLYRNHKRALENLAGKITMIDFQEVRKKMNQITVFNFGNSPVRTLLLDEEPYFVGNDVAELLGYELPRKAVLDHVDEEDRKTLIWRDCSKTELLNIWSGTDKTNKNIISESGVYSLIFASKLPEAKKFKHWVTNDVLPSIRKHGMYAMDELLDNPDLLIAVSMQYKEEKQKRLAAEQQALEYKDKADFADAIVASVTSISVGEFAKVLNQNGVDTGQRRLFAWMRENGYLMKEGDSYNLPTQRAMNLGLFEINERTYVDPNTEEVRTSRTTKITGKGQKYFFEKFNS